MDNQHYLLKNEIIKISDRLKDIFKLIITHDELIIKLIPNKTKFIYKKLKNFIDKITNVFAEFNIHMTLKIVISKFTKRRNLLLLLFSLIRYKQIISTSKQLNFDLNFSYLDQLELMLNNQTMYLTINSKLNKTIGLFLTDFLIIKHPNYNPILSNETFIKTVSEITKLSIKPKYIRLPSLYVNEELDTQQLIKSLYSLHQFSNRIDVLSFDIFYQVENREIFRAKSNREIIIIAEYIFSFVLHIFSLFMNSYLIINLKIIDVTDEFPIVSLIQNLSSFLKENINKKFVVNIKSLFYFNKVGFVNRNIVDEENSLFINRTLCKVGDFTKIYLLFFVINKKIPKLRKKYIMLSISRYLLKFKFYEFNKMNNVNYETMDHLNMNLDSKNICDYDRMPNQLSSIFKYVESENESENILFCRNYSPWDKI